MSIPFDQLLQAYQDTIAHKRLVAELMLECCSIIAQRGLEHDDSKLETEEFPYFAELTPKLKSSTYNSDQYKGFKEQLKPALDHHYANNRHHPEHFKNGVRDMTLFDLIELMVDIFASSKRQANGNLRKSLEDYQQSYQITEDLKMIMENTMELFDK